MYFSERSFTVGNSPQVQDQLKIMKYLKQQQARNERKRNLKIQNFGSMSHLCKDKDPKD